MSASRTRSGFQVLMIVCLAMTTLIWAPKRRTFAQAEPVLELEVRPSTQVLQDSNEWLTVELLAKNVGGVGGGGSLTVSIPDAADLLIREASAPIVVPVAGNCRNSERHAWVLRPGSPCQLMKLSETCNLVTEVSDTMAEVWIEKWDPEPYIYLTLRVRPLAGIHRLKIMSRTAVHRPGHPCDFVMNPIEEDSDGIDQQGFPVKVLEIQVEQAVTPEPPTVTIDHPTAVSPHPTPSLKSATAQDSAPAMTLTPSSPIPPHLPVPGRITVNELLILAVLVIGGLALILFILVLLTGLTRRS